MLRISLVLAASLACFMDSAWATQQAQPTPEKAQAERGDIALNFEGAEFLKAKDLRGALAFELKSWKDGLALNIVADDCAYQLEQRYHELGFPNSRVQAKTSPSPPAIRFVIEEGQRRTIERWEFLGALPAADLGPEVFSGLYGEETPAPLVQSRLSSLPRKIARRFQAAGFLNVSVSEPVVSELSQPGQRLVRIAIEPGVRFRLGGIEHNLDGTLAEQIGLDGVLAGAIGSTEEIPVFDPRWVPASVRATEIALGDAGYLDARVEASTQMQNGLVKIVLQAAPGETVRLGRLILPEGLKLRDSFLRKRINLSPGQTLTPEDLDQAVVRLYRSGRFESVRLLVQGEGSERDLVLKATEQPSQETFLEPGYGSFERSRLRAGWRHNNVGGVARSVRVEGVIAEKADRLVVGWNDPWTLGNRWVLDITADTSLRKLPAYARRTSSIGVFGSRPFGHLDRWTTDVGVRVSRISVADVRVDLLSSPELTEALAEDLSSTTLEWGIGYDSRNHPLIPRSGQVAQFSLQHSLDASGSAPLYTKLQMGWSRFYTLSERQTLAFGLRAAALIPEGSAALPLGLRLFSGGENTVRSFREDELGPTDVNGTPVGGEGRSTLSIEFTQDLGDSRWQGAAFFDIGNVVSNASDLGKFEDLEMAVGLGVRYLLPIGPIRLDLGYNPEASAQDPDTVLHFSVGMAF